jgi:hypothetical protein
MINRKCPSCHSDPGKSIVKSKNDASGSTFEELKNNFVGLRGNQTFFEYHRCKQCYLCFAPRYFSDLELALVYKNMPPNLVGDDQIIVEKTHRAYAKYIVRNVDSPLSLLELGADLGLVTGPVVNDLKIMRGVLIEPNLEVRNQLKESIGYNDEFKVIDYLDDIQDSQTFDLFIGIHVLDHLLEPLEDLQIVRKKMNYGGKLFIVVHNQKSLLAKILRAKWPPYCLQHPQIFDRASISKLLINAGFKNIVIKRTTNYVGFQNIIQIFFTLFKINIKLLQYLPNFPFPIKLGNMIVSAEVA